MDALVELDALSDFIQPFTPVNTAIELLNLPKEPYDGMLVMRFLDEDPRMVNAWRSEHIRRWQVLYFHSRTSDVIQVSTRIAKAFIHGITIPYTDENGAMWFVRVRAYSVGQPQETESGKVYNLSILETKTGSVRSQEQFVKMEQYIMNLTAPAVMNDLTHSQIEGASFNSLDGLEAQEEI